MFEAQAIGLHVRRIFSLSLALLTIYHCAQWQIVKCVCEIFPHVRVPVLSADLVVEPVHDGNVPAFVVSPQKGNKVGVFELETEQETYSLNGVVPPVYKVPYHHVLGARDLSPNSKHLQDIVELPMDVSGYHHWRTHWLYVRFFENYLLELLAKLPDLDFGQGLALLDLLEALINVQLALLHMNIEYYQI